MRNHATPPEPSDPRPLARYFWPLLIVLAVYALLSLQRPDDATTPRTVSYSEMKHLIKDGDAKEVTLEATAIVRRTAYIIADLTPSLRRVLGRHDFRNDYDPKIFTRYRENDGGVFIQAFGYDTLVNQAKKRNQAFFTILLGK